MSEISELAKGLRAFNEDILNLEPYTCEQRAKAAADALEAQAKRIAELEELLTEPIYASEHYVLNKTYKKHDNEQVGRITVSFGWMRRLHAALKGED